MSYADLLEYYPSWVDYRLRVSSAGGTADLTTGAPLTPAHLFRIASHSEIYAAVMLQLAGQGRLRLDDTLASRMPGERSVTMTPFETPAT